MCRLGQEHRRRKETLQRCLKPNRVAIRVNLDPLEATTAFPYLGFTFTFNNSNWEALYSNFCKAQSQWGVVEIFLGKRGT